MNSLRFPQRNGTHADTLAAIGAADALKRLDPVLIDIGNEIEVKLSRDLQFADLANVGPGFRYLEVASSSAKDSEEKQPKKKTVKPRPPTILPAMTFDYAGENDKYKRQQEAKKTHDTEIASSQQEDSPDPEFRAYRIVKTLQAESGPNSFIERFFALTPEERETAIWKGFNGEKAFFFGAPLVQLFNPQAAKGYSLLKPSGTDRNDKTKEKWAEPFNEWLRYRGFFAGCAGWFVGSKREHLRVYCPIPGHIPFSLYQVVAAQFRAEPLAGSAPKVDCLGTLRLVRYLIERSDVFARPARSIAGIFVTHYYPSSRNVKTVVAIDRLAVPDWFDLQSKEDAARWLNTLEEHDKALCRLDDDISEEMALLTQYRRFLQRQGVDALPDLIEFFAAYGHYVFRLRGQGKRLLPQFTSHSVEAILQPNYSQILTNPGFQAIAGALRAATVTAQVIKRNGGDHREIQYGILPELRRKGLVGRDEFMQTVADFVARFNAESARRFEDKKSGFRISQEDLAAFVQLMDQSTWQIAASLLRAMATCKLGKEEKEEAEE